MQVHHLFARDDNDDDECVVYFEAFAQCRFSRQQLFGRRRAGDFAEPRDTTGYQRRNTNAPPKAQGNSRRANEKEKFSPFNFLFSSTQKKIFLFSCEIVQKISKRSIFVVPFTPEAIGECVLPSVVSAKWL